MQSRIMWPISKEIEVHTNRPIRWVRIEIIRWDFKVITIKFMFNDLKENTVKWMDREMQTIRKVKYRNRKIHYLKWKFTESS